MIEVEMPDMTDDLKSRIYHPSEDPNFDPDDWVVPGKGEIAHGESFPRTTYEDREE